MQSAKICLLHSFPLVARRLSVLTQFLYYGSSRLVVKAAAAKKRNSHQNRTESHLRENSSSSQGEMRLQLKKINGGCEGLRWNIQILFTYNVPIVIDKFVKFMLENSLLPRLEADKAILN